MRLKSTILGLIGLPPLVAALGWIWQERVHVAAVCVFLFANGFFYVYAISSITYLKLTRNRFRWPYTSSLAYIVDSNKGRSSTAVAMNSAFRGGLAFVATEIAVPLQEGLGNGTWHACCKMHLMARNNLGWMMTLWAFMMLINGSLIMLTYWKGKSWRENAELREARSENI